MRLEARAGERIDRSKAVSFTFAPRFCGVVQVSANHFLVEL